MSFFHTKRSDHVGTHAHLVFNYWDSSPAGQNGPFGPYILFGNILIK